MGVSSSKEVATDFLNKNVIVTGGAGGLGRGFSLEFAHRGANVICADISENAGNELIEEAASFSGNIHFVQGNMGNAETCDRIAEKARELGGVDVLCNNVGIQPPASFSPASRNLISPASNAVSGSASVTQVPRSQTITVPAPYSPSGTRPSKAA